MELSETLKQIFSTTAKQLKGSAGRAGSLWPALNEVSEFLQYRLLSDCNCTENYQGNLC